MYWILCLVLLGASIGALELYASTGDVAQLAVGGLLGIVTTFCSLVGFIPVFGVCLYQAITSELFEHLRVSLPILYYYGMALSVICTIVAVILIICVILIATDRL